MADILRRFKKNQLEKKDYQTRKWWTGNSSQNKKADNKRTV